MNNTNVVFVWLCVNEWQLLQLMTVDTPDYYNSGGFYKISGACLQQLDNICKYMYHTLFSHLILLIFIILVWPWSIWFYLWMASSGEGWPFILFWAVCVGCVLDRNTEAGFHWVLVFPTGRILLSEMLCCVLVIQQLSFGKAEIGICLCLPKAAPH